jgi:hypothetical protein
MARVARAFQDYSAASTMSQTGRWGQEVPSSTLAPSVAKIRSPSDPDLAHRSARQQVLVGQGQRSPQPGVARVRQNKFGGLGPHPSRWLSPSRVTRNPVFWWICAWYFRRLAKTSQPMNLR